MSNCCFDEVSFLFMFYSGFIEILSGEKSVGKIKTAMDFFFYFVKCCIFLNHFSPSSE